MQGDPHGQRGLYHEHLLRDSNLARGGWYDLSSRAKGDRAEDRFGELLRRMGYDVHVTMRSPARKVRGRWVSTGNNDLFGLFDVVAKRKGRPTLWVQVTHESGVSERRKKLRDGASSFSPPHDEVLIAAWVKPTRPGVKGTFKLYRQADDYLVGPGWTIQLGDKELPWLLPDRQVKLK